MRRRRVGHPWRLLVSPRRRPGSLPHQRRPARTQHAGAQADEASPRLGKLCEKRIALLWSRVREQRQRSLGLKPELLEQISRDPLDGGGRFGIQGGLAGIHAGHRQLADAEQRPVAMRCSASRRLASRGSPSWCTRSSLAAQVGGSPSKCCRATGTARSVISPSAARAAPSASLRPGKSPPEHARPQCARPAA
jgi:hypothetical protein